MELRDHRDLSKRRIYQFLLAAHHRASGHREWIPWKSVPCLCTSVFLALFACFAAGAELKAGDAPPDVFGKTSTGERVHLADHHGKIVVISFWASWCGPCRKELPMLLILQKKATREKVVVLSVNWRQNYDEFARIKKVLKEETISLISDADGHAGNAYGVKSIPHMIIVGRDGKIAAIHVGYSEEEIPTLVDEINSAWLKGEPEDAAHE